MKSIKKILVLLCAALMLFSMSGCRDSSVIEQIVYDYLRAHQTDMEKNTYDDQEDNELDDELNDIEKNDESDRENEKDEIDPVYEPEQEPTQENTAGEANYDNDSNLTNPAEISPMTIGDGTISGGQSTNDPSSSEEDPSTDSGEGISADREGEFGTTGGDTVRLVVDDYGNRYEVPQNVDTVAAVDSAAVAVLMLGGVDRLAATNEDLTSDPLATAVFSGLANVPSLWTESGTTEPLSSTELQKLIEIHPDVCFETSGSATLTNAQVEALRENGIYYVVLPAPTSAANIKLIAQVIGQVLGDHTADGGYDSVSRYETYRSWVDTTLSSIKEAGGNSVYTLYVDDWDQDAEYKVEQKSDCFGSGVAVINNSKTESGMAVTNFLGNASVTNVTGLGAFVRKETVYFTPINGTFSSIMVTGTAASRLTPIKLFDLSEAESLGAPDFHYLVVGSNTAAKELEDNVLWQSYDKIVSGDGNLSTYGFLDDYGTIVRSTIVGEYEILVNPRGIGAWASGSVESILETVWASYALAGGYSESEMRAAVSEFYETFYDYTLSDSQLDAILAGEA